MLLKAGMSTYLLCTNIKNNHSKNTVMIQKCLFIGDAIVTNYKGQCTVSRSVLWNKPWQGDAGPWCEAEGSWITLRKYQLKHYFCDLCGCAM